MLVTMNEILVPAQKEHFAIPAFNVSSNMLLTGVIEHCEKTNSPVIIEIHPDELSFIRPSFMKMALEVAKLSKVPICLHLDHGANFKQVMQAISLGFTSVMIDASLESYDNNVSITKKVVEAAHSCNVSVEAELGTIGKTDGGEGGTDEIIYTDPDVAKSFVETTNIDTLAVAIGTRHGLYPSYLQAKLNIPLLKEIVSLVNIPLVLHGGSDNPDDEISEAVHNGICKINISSDIKMAFYNKCREVLASDKYMREPNAIYPPCIAEMQKVVDHKLKLFGSYGKAGLYR